MKKFFFLLLSLCIFHSPLKADFCCDIFTDETYDIPLCNFYMEIFSGANFINATKYHNIKTKYETGYIISAAAGFCLGWGFRLEAEYAFRRNILEQLYVDDEDYCLHAHFQSSSYMGNLFWDSPISFDCGIIHLRPYVGAGIGYDFQQILGIRDTPLTIDSKNKHLSWQVMGGFNFPIFYQTAVAIEYKYHQGGYKNIHNHSIGIGLIYGCGSHFFPCYSAANY